MATEMRVDVHGEMDHLVSYSGQSLDLEAEYSVDETETQSESSSSEDMDEIDDDEETDEITMIEATFLNSNEALVLSLERRGVINSASVAAAFREVDRAQFVPEQCLDCAYDDSPLRARDIRYNACVVHLSAPSIYAAALEALELKSRDAFLNVGSGSGYMSMLAASILGPHAIHHCLERCPLLARRCQETFSNDPNMRHVIVHQGGASLFELDPKNSTLRFDKIYCAAGGKACDKHMLARFLKPNGILVGPFEIADTAQDEGVPPFVDQDQAQAPENINHNIENQADEEDAWPRWRRRIHRPQFLLCTKLQQDILVSKELMAVQFTPLVREPCTSRLILKGPIWGEASPDLFSPAFRFVVAFIARANSKQGHRLPWHVWQVGVFACLAHDDVQYSIPPGD